MEPREIAACYVWTADEYAASYALHRRTRPQPAPRNRFATLLNSRAFLAGVLIPLWVLVALIVLREGDVGVVQVLVLIVIAVSGALLVRGPRFAGDGGRAENAPDPARDFAARQDCNQEVCYRFTAAGLAITTATGSVSVAWEAIVMVAAGAEGFLFYRNGATYHWLPRHALSADEAEALEEWVQEKVGRCISV